MDSPLLGRLHSLSLAGTPPSSYSAFLEKCSSRRRSSAGPGRLSLSAAGQTLRLGSREHLYDPFDRALDDIGGQLDELRRSTPVGQQLDGQSAPPLERLLDIPDDADAPQLQEM